MSFVSKGEKKKHNAAKSASSTAVRPAASDRFGKKGDGNRPGAAKNMAPGSKDKSETPVSEDAMEGKGYTSEKSSYDPASGKRAASVADLRNAAKLISERSDAGSASPTGSEGGQQAKHASSSKNKFGFEGKAGMSAMDKKTMKKPRGAADQMSDEMEDPMDEDQEDNGQAESGMTPKGKSRKGNSTLRNMKRKMAIELD